MTRCERCKSQKWIETRYHIDSHLTDLVLLRLRIRIGALAFQFFIGFWCRPNATKKLVMNERNQKFIKKQQLENAMELETRQWACADDILACFYESPIRVMKKTLRACGQQIFVNRTDTVYSKMCICLLSAIVRLQRNERSRVEKKMPMEIIIIRCCCCVRFVAVFSETSAKKTR